MCIFLVWNYIINFLSSLFFPLVDDHFIISSLFFALPSPQFFRVKSSIPPPFFPLVFSFAPHPPPLFPGKSHHKKISHPLPTSSDTFQQRDPKLRFANHFSKLLTALLIQTVAVTNDIFDLMDLRLGRLERQNGWLFTEIFGLNNHSVCCKF